MTWAEAEKAYLEEHRGVRRPITLRGISSQLQHFEEFVHPAGIADIRPDHLMDYLAFQAKRVKLETAWGYVLRLAPFFRWAARRELVLWNPAEDLKSPRFSRPQRRVLNQAETLQLLAQPDPATPYGARDAAILEVFYGTGLRLAENRALDISDVDLARRQLVVREGKGGIPRLMPIGNHLAGVLGRYLEHTRPQLVKAKSTPALWLNNQGQRFSGLVTTVREHAQAAGFTGVSAHTLRHAFATHLLEGGASVRMVQVLLGHRCLQATQIYTHLVPQELLREFRRTHPRARRKRRRHNG